MEVHIGQLPLSPSPQRIQDLVQCFYLFSVQNAGTESELSQQHQLTLLKDMDSLIFKL